MPKEPNGAHYLCCNADESEPGAFKDREILRWVPHLLIEGCLIAARAIRAEHVYIYVRGEYPIAIQRIRRAIRAAKRRGILGKSVLGTDFSFTAEVRIGAGAFVCGEETALIHSIEGKRGIPRIRPPYPSASGLWGMPTGINNVDVDQEMADLAENHLMYNIGSHLVSQKFRALKKSITGQVTG